MTWTPRAGGPGKGYRYLAITDHTKGSASRTARRGEADGADRLINTAMEARRFTILKGSEVDIGPTERSTCPIGVGRVDIVVASVPLGFKQSQDQITSGPVAIRNPA